MAEMRERFVVEIAFTCEEGHNPIDEIDVERLIRGEVNLRDRIVEVHASRENPASAAEEPQAAGSGAE